MPQTPSFLDEIRIASPCTASWAEMTGTDRVRHCRLCKMNVYNLSEMTRADAERLVTETQGPLCIRFHRRADGTVLTDNCPVGLRRIRRGLARLLAGYAALLLVTFQALGFISRQHPNGMRVRYLDPFSRLCNWLSPPQLRNAPMGAIAVGRRTTPLPPPPIQLTTPPPVNADRPPITLPIAGQNH